MQYEERLEQDGVEPGNLIRFYHGDDIDFGFMSNFSLHSLVALNPFTGEVDEYRTAEHRFQAMKATTPDDHEHVRCSGRPHEAKRRGRHIDLTAGWGDSYGDLCYYVMFETVLLKFIQNDDARMSLLATGQKILWEDAPHDDIWGIRAGNDYRGKNLLGRCLMDVREILR